MLFRSVGYTAVTANPGANQFVGAMSLQRDSVATVTAEEAASMVNYNNGKLTSVDGHLTAAYEQHTEAYEKAGNQVYDIRFIALSHVALTDGYTVTVRAKTTENTTDKDILFDNLKCEAYTSLKGYNGLTAYEYTAAQLNGKSFIAVVLTGIPAGVAYDFEVVASYTTKSGITMTDIVRTLHVAADGTFSSTPVAQ